ncbi:MAG: EAL domain-containing protein [Candidatus Thermoplasmatota archaeon]|nr:EAL domain-containing protein [Candidatus Thermoplasmatota archaeon]
MQRHAENLLSKSLLLSLQNKVERAESEIRQRSAAAVTVAARPFLVEQVQRADTPAGDAEAVRALERDAKSFLSSGFSAIALYGKDGRELARAGTFAQRPELAVPPDPAGQAQLLWKGGFLLRADVNILNEGRTIVGKVIAEAPLPEMTGMFKDARRLGKTGELALCAPSGAGMQCFPTTLNPRVFTLGTQSVSGEQLPMAHALQGQTGFIVAQDYRQQQVVAAYSPVKPFGLGMVLKMDRAELYAPVRSQARYMLPILAGVLAAAVLLLRWQLAPLVARLVRSEQKARETIARLRDSESRMQAMLNNVDEGIVTISGTGEIELFNPGAERLFGFRNEEAVGKNVSLLMPEPYRSEHDAYIERYLRTGEAHVIGVGREVTGQRKGGEIFPMDLRISEFYLAGRRHFIGVMRDITQRKAAEAKILHLANYDALTGLPNRNLAQDRILQAIARAQRSGTQFAVMFIDLDHFKTINDSLGHNMGDLLLQRVAGRILACLREEDTVGRQGGDEFIVLLGSLDFPQDAAVVAHKILHALSTPYSINERDLHTSASIGIAIHPEDGRDVETLLKNSDTAMYHAKESGRNNYQFFAHEMNVAAAERLLLETSLRRAIAGGEMLLHYQPLVSLADGRIVATEALVRWKHPELGFVDPARFIPVAEDSGLIAPLGEWVLRQACLQLKQWHALGIQPPRMVVNLSSRQFREKNLVRIFSGVFRETGVEPRWLGLEITESVIMENPEVTIGILKELKALGIELSLDDFGTGYSSLSYLKRFPIDKLKIDQSFVHDITTDPDDEAMVTAIISMARHLNIRVVAEGVETEAQLAFLREHGCDEYQGYLFSRPLPADELHARLGAATSIA